MLIFRFMIIFKLIIGTSVAALSVWPFAPLAITQYSFTQNSTTSAQTKLTIKVGLIVFPPLVQQDSDGRCYGNAVDTIYGTFPLSEYNVELYCTTPARVYRDFSDAKIDLTLNVKSTLSLVDSVYFSKNPIDVLEVILYSKKELQGSTVSAIHLFNYHGMREKLINDGYKIFDQPNGKEAITIFIRGGTDALISYKRPFEFYLSQVSSRNSFTPDQLAFEQRSLLEVPTYFVVNKSSLNAELLIEVIDAKN